MSASLYIVGTGRLGCSLAVAASAAAGSGLRVVGCAFHSRAGEERGKRWLSDVPLEPLSAPVGLRGADTVVLCVRDDVIAEAAAALAPHLGAEQVLLHTSGLADSTVFDGLGLACELGSMHPLQSFVDPASGPERFRGAFVAVEGSPAARARASVVAEALGARVVTLRAGGKPAYHAAAVVASNYLVALTALAADLCALAGLDARTSIEMLAPLQRGALDNLAARGLPDALTGPIARGDGETVRAHLAVLRSFPRAAREAYARLGELACELAREQGLAEPAVAELRALLAGAESGGGGGGD